MQLSITKATAVWEWGSVSISLLTFTRPHRLIRSTYVTGVVKFSWSGFTTPKYRLLYHPLFLLTSKCTQPTNISDWAYRESHQSENYRKWVSSKCLGLSILHRKSSKLAIDQNFGDKLLIQNCLIFCESSCVCHTLYLVCYLWSLLAASRTT